jgi:hypothetical protein
MEFLILRYMTPCILASISRRFEGYQCNRNVGTTRPTTRRNIAEEQNPQQCYSDSVNYRSQKLDLNMSIKVGYNYFGEGLRSLVARTVLMLALAHWTT